MKLSALAGEAFDPDPEIRGIATDSRAVEAGDLFAALAGEHADGAKFIDEALRKGAVAILGAPSIAAPAPVVRDENPRRRLAQIAARFWPRQPDTIAGVTGTNGKTSTAIFAAQLWERLGVAAGSIGTLGARAPGFAAPLAHTTPEPVTLHRVLNDMAAAGTSHAAMEVSSHGLAQHRADGVRFSIAAFTNITRDHLDYHADFDAYFAAKKRLFTELLPDDGVAVVNADGADAAALIEQLDARRMRILTTGAAGEDVWIKDCRPRSTGLALTLVAGGGEHPVNLPLIGGFQAENAALAAGVVIASGFAPPEVIPLLGEISGAPGRMEPAGALRGASVYVDYAHTPDAVAAAINAARPHTEGRLAIILGAGGDRDREKRAAMGAAASAADAVIVTDDNPRHEDPAAIRAAVLSGAPGAVEIGDRREAIRKGLSMLAPGDVLIVAGKGHETGQIVGDEIQPFSDAGAVREEIAAIGGTPFGEERGS